MKSVTQHLKSLSVAGIFFVSLYTLYAWTGPSQLPPGGNVASPLNTSTSSQIKTGGLGVTDLVADTLYIGGNILSLGTTTTNGFKLLTGASAGKVLTSDAEGNASWQTGGSGSVDGDGNPVWSQAYSNLSYAGQATFTHNLGYIPVCVVTEQFGNLNVHINNISTTQITIGQYNDGYNNANGTIYCWKSGGSGGGAGGAGGLGYGQTWKNVTTSRTVGTTYTNETTMPIFVNLYATCGSNGSGNTMTLYVDGVSFAATYASLGGNAVGGTVGAVVPVGSTYRAVSSNSLCNVQSWSELRCDSNCGVGGGGGSTGASNVKAWVNFNGQGPATNRPINASSNVSSVVRVSAGLYTVNFTTPMSSANYTAITNAGGQESPGVGFPSWTYTWAQTASSYTFYVWHPNYGANDRNPIINVAIIEGNTPSGGGTSGITDTHGAVVWVDASFAAVCPDGYYLSAMDRSSCPQIPGRPDNSHCWGRCNQVR